MAYNETDLNKAKTVLLLITFVIIPLISALSGCGSPSLVYYENQEWNFSVKYPDNWELSEDSRVANDFSLQATKGLFNKSSARIVITSWFLIPEEGPPAELETTMENYLTAVAGMTHIFKSLEVLQISKVIDYHTHRMIWATVSVPTLDIVEDSKSNQMGQRNEHVFQTIDIYILRNSQGQDIVVEVYKGTDDGLNSQAEEIVESIKFINE